MENVSGQEVSAFANFYKWDRTADLVVAGFGGAVAVAALAGAELGATVLIGQPIPALYGAGELGEAVGMLYPANGGNLSESVCFGRLAAQHALGRVSLRVADRDLRVATCG